MSLLLDALKKAADDKQKATQGNIVKPSADAMPVDQNVVVGKSNTAGSAEPPIDEKLEPLSELVFDDQQEKKSGEEELALEDIETPAAPEPPLLEENQTSSTASVKAEVATGAANSIDAENVQQAKSAERSKTSISGVSDEALSMLIHKTNRDVKQWKRTIFISVFLVSLIILVSGGVYYYFDTQSEIDELNRRHGIAMQAMRNKTSQQETPQSSAIIRNLVSKADLDDKVAFTKKQISKTQVNKTRAEIKPTAAEKPKQGKHDFSNASVDQFSATSRRKSAASISFQKTKKADRVSEKLEKAWQDYETGQYDSAKRLYAEVLKKEQDNRDAMLGLGAIAIIEKDNVTARKVYRDLLKMDPRDPVAIAALTSLQSNKLSLKESEKYLLNILQSNPDAAELNFALANNYSQQEKWKAAQEYYFSAWQNDPENANYLFNLAVSLDQLGKSTQAIRFYNDCLRQAENRQVSFSRQAVQKRIAVLSAL